MVRHDYGGMEVQKVPVKSRQTPAHGPSNIGSSQRATAVSGIEPLLHTFAEAGFVITLLLERPRLGILLEPGLLFRAELVEFGLSQRGGRLPSRHNRRDASEEDYGGKRA